MINNVVIQGNVCADIEVKQTTNGISVARFNVAVNEKEKTNFLTVCAWRQTAEFVAKYFRKGSQIGVVGKLDQRTYTDKDGVKRNVVEIVAQNVHFCGAKSNSDGAGAGAAAADNGDSYGDLSAFEEILSDGDTPF